MKLLWGFCAVCKHILWLIWTDKQYEINLELFLEIFI